MDKDAMKNLIKQMKHAAGYGAGPMAVTHISPSAPSVLRALIDDLPEVKEETTPTLNLDQLDDLSEEPLEVMMGIAAVEAATRALVSVHGVSPRLVQAIRKFNDGLLQTLVVSIDKTRIANSATATANYAELIRRYITDSTMTTTELHTSIKAVEYNRAKTVDEAQRLSKEILGEFARLSKRRGAPITGQEKQVFEAILRDPDPVKLGKLLEDIRKENAESHPISIHDGDIYEPFHPDDPRLNKPPRLTKKY